MAYLLPPRVVLDILAHTSHMLNSRNSGINFQKIGVPERVIGMGDQSNQAIMGEVYVIHCVESGVLPQMVDVVSLQASEQVTDRIAWYLEFTIGCNVSRNFPNM